MPNMLQRRKPVLHPRLAARFRVWDDVGGVEQLLVAEAAQGALNSSPRSFARKVTEPSSQGSIVQKELRFIEAFRTAPP